MDSPTTPWGNPAHSKGNSAGLLANGTGRDHCRNLAINPSGFLLCCRSCLTFFKAPVKVRLSASVVGQGCPFRSKTFRNTQVLRRHFTQLCDSPIFTHARFSIAISFSWKGPLKGMIHCSFAEIILSPAFKHFLSFSSSARGEPPQMPLQDMTIPDDTTYLAIQRVRPPHRAQTFGAIPYNPLAVIAEWIPPGPFEGAPVASRSRGSQQESPKNPWTQKT